MKPGNIASALLIVFGLNSGSAVLVPPGQTPVYRIKLRVHNGHSTLPPPKLRQSLLEVSEELLCIGLMSKPHHTVVDVAHNNNVAMRVPFPPLVEPTIPVVLL